MSNVTEMPEILDFQGIIASTQATYEDKTSWTFEALDRAVADCAQKAFRYSKKASISMQIDFTKGNMDQMVIEVSVKTKMPDPAPHPYMAYSDRMGRLVAEDPSQTKLPLDIKRTASNDRD